MAEISHLGGDLSLTRALVEAMDTVSYASLSTGDRRAVRSLVLDHLGVAAAGAATDSAEVFRKYARRVGGSAGPELAIVGASRVAPAMAAALANAAAGHSVEFDDLHNTGIFSWNYLYEIGRRQDELWQTYLDKLAAHGLSRNP